MPAKRPGPTVSTRRWRTLQRAGDRLPDDRGRDDQYLERLNVAFRKRRGGYQPGMLRNLHGVNKTSLSPEDRELGAHSRVEREFE